MKTRLMLMAGLIGLLMGPAPDLWAGGFGEVPSCLVNKNAVEDPSGTKLTGTMAVDILQAVNPGRADVVLRLERYGDTKFFRMLFEKFPGFGQPDLTQYQTRLCDILNLPSNSLNGQTLAGQIISAFQLQGTRFVITPRSIRDTQTLPDLSGNVCCGNVPINSDADLAIPTSGTPPRAMTLFDVVIFAQP